MELFKKLVLSLFPDTLFDTNSALNPANMFISFINARQFFSVVHRRVVEHYKLNFFDTALDPFEIKIGFGDGHTIKPRDIEPYFAYCCVANINGQAMITPVYQSTMIACICACRFRSSLSGLSHYYYYALVMTVHHLSIICISKIKQFPIGLSEGERYQRFVDLFFSTYEFVLSLHYKNYSKIKFKKLKKELLTEVSTFFMLFYWYQKASATVILGHSTIQDFCTRLFQDELQKNPTKHLLEGRLKTYESTSIMPELSAVEKEIANIILPGDMQIKHLLGGKDIHLTVDTILGEICNTEEIHIYLTSFLESDKRFDEFLFHICQFEQLRKHFFVGMKKYLNHDMEEYLLESEEDGDELVSFIGSMMDIEQLIPESIKQESKSIERLINFFVTLVGGMWVARGDGGYMKTYKPQLLDILLSKFQSLGGNKSSAQYYYGLMLYNYSKNVFYYTFTYNQIKSGSDQFVIPTKSDIKEIPSNHFILSMFDQHAIAGAFQEISPTYTKIYLKQTSILQYFKTQYSKKVGHLLKHRSTNDFVKDVYNPIFNHLSEISDISSIIASSLHNDDISRIKDSLYRLDYRIVSDFLNDWYDHHGSLSVMFTDLVILNIISTLKDTLLGIYLFYAYLHTLELKNQTSYHTYTFLKTLAGDLYNISEHEVGLFVDILYKQAEFVLPIMIKRIKTDDNKQFLQLGADNRLAFIEDKTPQQIMTDIVGEDMMWLRGYLKNITYYNRRYLISSM